METIYIIGSIIAIYMFYTFFISKVEKYTNEEQTIAKSIVELFKNNTKPSFSFYLEHLTKINNTSDNLISKGVYNKLLNNKDLKINDVLSQI